MCPTDAVKYGEASAAAAGRDPFGGVHVLVHLVKLLDWDFTRPKDPPLPQIDLINAPWLLEDESFLSVYFPVWEPPWAPEGCQEEGDFVEEVDSALGEGEEGWGLNGEDCWHCGWPWTVRHRCPAWGVRCHRCGLPNHYARMCHTGSEDSSSQPASMSSAATVSTATGSVDSGTGSGTNSSRKKTHRKRKKTAKQRKRDQERLQKFLEKKALEQQLLEQGLEVEEIQEIISAMASSQVVVSTTEERQR